MKITSEIYQIENVRGANSYLVMNKDGILIIDTGLPGNGGKIIKYIEGLGKKSQDIHYIVLTHSDPDHSGSVAELKKITDAKIAIHEADAPSISGERQVKEMKGIPDVLLSFFLKRVMKFQTVKPDLLLKEGDEIEGFKIIHTPGHTPGSISLYGKEVLFSGDALQVNRKGNLTPSRKLMASDIKQAWESIRKINNLNLEFKILLPGHRKVILKDASKMLKDLLSNRSK